MPQVRGYCWVTEPKICLKSIHPLRYYWSGHWALVDTEHTTYGCEIVLQAETNKSYEHFDFLLQLGYSDSKSNCKFSTKYMLTYIFMNQSKIIF